LRKTCGEQAPGAHRRKRPSAHSRSRPREDRNVAPFVPEESDSRELPINTIPTLNEAYFSPSLWISRLVKSDEDGEALLQKFRAEFSPFFPFVVVPPDATFLGLKGESPFVLLISLMVACRDDSELQNALAKKIREIISFAVLVKGDQSLDLLQGVMLFLAWLVLPSSGSASIFNPDRMLTQFFDAGTTSTCT